MMWKINIKFLGINFLCADNYVDLTARLTIDMVYHVNVVFAVVDPISTDHTPV